MPRMGRMTLPNLMICSTLLRTMSTGIANPTPLFAPLGLYMAVLMPARDSDSASGRRKCLSSLDYIVKEHAHL